MASSEAVMMVGTHVVTPAAASACVMPITDSAHTSAPLTSKPA